MFSHTRSTPRNYHNHVSLAWYSPISVCGLEITSANVVWRHWRDIGKVELIIFCGVFVTAFCWCRLRKTSGAHCTFTDVWLLHHCVFRVQRPSVAIATEEKAWSKYVSNSICVLHLLGPFSLVTWGGVLASSEEIWQALHLVIDCLGKL